MKTKVTQVFTGCLGSTVTLLQPTSVGPPGPPGPNGSSAITLLAGANISGGRALVYRAGILRHADVGDIADLGYVLGVSVGAALSGFPVQILTSGEITGLSGLTVGQYLSVGTNGLLVANPPLGAAWLQHVAIATSSTTALVHLYNAIGLLNV